MGGGRQHARLVSMIFRSCIILECVLQPLCVGGVLGRFRLDPAHDIDCFQILSHTHRDYSLSFAVFVFGLEFEDFIVKGR